MGIKGRVYLNSNKTKKDKNIDNIIKELEETGVLKSNISPQMLNDRLVQFHDRIIKIDKIIEKYPNHRKVKDLKCLRKEYITKFTNLSKIIIAAALKKYKTFTNDYNDLFTDCLIEVLDNLFVKKKYDKEKSKLSSYIFEISRQTLVKETTKLVKEAKKYILFFE